jgi:hypothetical protein
LVALAEVLQGITGGVLGPGVVAITLGLVGHARLSSGAETADADRPQRASYAALLKNRRLLIFGACAALFQVASGR